MLLTDGPFLVQVASTQVRSRAGHCSVWLFRSFIACIVQSLGGLASGESVLAFSSVNSRGASRASPRAATLAQRQP